MNLVTWGWASGFFKHGPLSFDCAWYIKKLYNKLSTLCLICGYIEAVDHADALGLILHHQLLNIKFNWLRFIYKCKSSTGGIKEVDVFQIP